MSDYIRLIANLQQRIIRAAKELKDEGHVDLAILLNVCAEKLGDDGDKRLINDCIDKIMAEAEIRAKMKICPKCQTVMHPDKPCEKCGATLERTAP